VLDLKLTGIALQTRWLWLQQTDSQRAWSELPISVSNEVQAFFNASTYTVIGNGRNTQFWTGQWLHGRSIQSSAPTLMKFVSPRNHRRKPALCRVLHGLSSVIFRALGKETLCQVQKNFTRQKKKIGKEALPLSYSFMKIRREISKFSKQCYYHYIG
jgi:hypothetical protein